MGDSRHEHNTELSELAIFPTHAQDLSALKEQHCSKREEYYTGREATAEPWSISFKVEEISQHNHLSFYNVYNARGLLICSCAYFCYTKFD